jgi:zinc transport system substrate-binding protein
VFSRIVLVLTVAATVAGCGGAEPGSGAKQVVAAFYPLAFAAEQIAGDAVVVTNLTPPGVEPHDLEISAGDVRTLREADLVLYLGGGFQPAVERTVAGLRSAVDLLETQPAGDPADEMQVRDPHVWLDPLAYASIVRRIGQALEGEQQAESLAARLEALDAELERGLARCRRRDVVTRQAPSAWSAAASVCRSRSCANADGNR